MKKLDLWPEDTGIFDYSPFNEKGDLKSDKSRTRYAKKRPSSKTKSVRRKMARNSRRKTEDNECI